MKHILFVCTGNTCRSPMAEALFNTIAKQNNIDAVSSSSGIYANNGEEMTANAKQVLSEADIDLTHMSNRITENDMKNAHMIFGMTLLHARTLCAMFPEYSEKIHHFPKDISDPFGGDIVIYRKCRDEISDGIKTIIGYLKEDVK